MNIVSNHIYSKAILALAALWGMAGAHAADINGYTALYERGIGGLPRSCDQIVKTSDKNWDKITDNRNDSIFCVERGDHTAKGLLKLNFSGTERQRNWLIPVNPGADPWKDRVENRATLKYVEFNGDWWIVHDIAFNGKAFGKNGRSLIVFSNGTSNNIVDNVLAENAGGQSVTVEHGANNNTLQNSVVRNNEPKRGAEWNCVTLKGATNTRLINNELYDCTKSVYIGPGNAAAGTIIENNDMYKTSELYTNCNGKYDRNGPCAAAKGILSMKNGGSSDNIVRVIHNRLWGARPNDRKVCCTATSFGPLTTFSLKDCGKHGCKRKGEDADYVLYKNNILMDAQAGVTWTRRGSRNQTIVGNIFYDIRQIKSGWPSYAIKAARGADAEMYLNTIVDADHWLQLKGSNNDIKCNVIVDGGKADAKSVHASTIVDYNVFYDTPVYTTARGFDNNIQAAVRNSETTDYCFFRKLKTGPEKFCIPHARPTSASPHYLACSTTLGRPGVGVDG